MGVWFGFPLADPIVGLGISVTIRALAGIEPEVIHQIEHALEHVRGIERFPDIKVLFGGYTDDAVVRPRTWSAFPRAF